MHIQKLHIYINWWYIQQQLQNLWYKLKFYKLKILKFKIDVTSTSYYLREFSWNNNNMNILALSSKHAPINLGKKPNDRNSKHDNINVAFYSNLIYTQNSKVLIKGNKTIYLSL